MATLTIVSSLRESQLTPRTPHSARYPAPYTSTSAAIPEEDDALLNDEEQLFGKEEFEDEQDVKERLKSISSKDRKGMALLIVLCEYYTHRRNIQLLI